MIQDILYLGRMATRSVRDQMSVHLDELGISYCEVVSQGELYLLPIIIAMTKTVTSMSILITIS